MMKLTNEQLEIGAKAAEVFEGKFKDDWFDHAGRP